MPHRMICNPCGRNTEWRSIYERRFAAECADKVGKLVRIGWRCKNCGLVRVDKAERIKRKD